MEDRLFQFENLTSQPEAPPYLHRWTLACFRDGRRVYLHRYLGSDWSRDMHDHPKAFWSIGLWGGYVEQTPDGMRQWRAPWVRRFPAEHRHRLRASRPRGRAEGQARGILWSSLDSFPDNCVRSTVNIMPAGSIGCEAGDLYGILFHLALAHRSVRLSPIPDFGCVALPKGGGRRSVWVTLTLIPGLGPLFFVILLTLAVGAALDRKAV